MDIPTLETERLLITVPDERDARALLDYTLATEWYHAPWSPPKSARWDTLLFAYERAQQYQYECEQGQAVRLWFRDRAAPRGPFVGAASLSQIQLGARRACVLGYHLDPAREGQGLMHEALRQVIRYAFRTLLLHRIEANYCPENTRSANVLKRLGFQIEGCAMKYLFIDGRFRDHVLTALVNDELPNAETLCTPQ